MCFGSIQYVNLTTISYFVSNFSFLISPLLLLDQPDTAAFHERNKFHRRIQHRGTRGTCPPFLESHTCKLYSYKRGTHSRAINCGVKLSINQLT